VGHPIHSAGEQRSKSEKRCDSHFTLVWSTAPGRNDHDKGNTVGPEHEPKLYRQLCRGTRNNFGASLKNSSGFGEGEQQHARMDGFKLLQTVVHSRHHAEVSTATAQCPKEVLLRFFASDNDSAVRQHDLCCDQVVCGESEASDERSIAA